jgi:hypothetical protein
MSTLGLLARNGPLLQALILLSNLIIEGLFARSELLVFTEKAFFQLIVSLDVVSGRVLWLLGVL